MQLTNAEAKALADAAANVSELYEISVVSEKTMAWIQLSIVACGIYGPRYMAVNARAKAERKPKLVPGHFPSPQTVDAKPAVTTPGFNSINLN